MLPRSNDLGCGEELLVAVDVAGHDHQRIIERAAGVEKVGVASRFQYGDEDGQRLDTPRGELAHRAGLPEARYPEGEECKPALEKKGGAHERQRVGKRHVRGIVEQLQGPQEQTRKLQRDTVDEDDGCDEGRACSRIGRGESARHVVGGPDSVSRGYQR